MDVASLGLLAALSVFVGVLIGGVGIGGILLVPILTYVLGVDIHIAIAAAMFSYLFSGLVGGVIYARKGSIEWHMTVWLFMGAAPAAFLGAFMSSVVSARGLEFFIAVLVVFAGLNALLSRKDSNHGETALPPLALFAVGAVTGIGSSLSGTGGPLVLVPLLVWLKLPALVAVGLAQVVQLPIALLATAGNYIYGTVDFQLGFVIAAGLSFGAIGGARFAHVVPQAVLQRVVAWVLVAAGIFIVVKISIQ